MFDALQDASCNFLGHHAAAAAAAVHFERERFLSSLSATPNNINYTSVDGNSLSVSFVMFDVLQVAAWSFPEHHAPGIETYIPLVLEKSLFFKPN